MSGKTYITISTIWSMVPAIAKVFLFLFYMTKLQDVFYGTVYVVSKHTIIAVIIVSIIYVLLFVTDNILYYLYFMHSLSIKYYSDASLLIFVFICLMDGIISTYLCYSFIWRLVQLTIISCDDNELNTSLLGVNDRQKSLIYLTTKTGLLSFIAIVSSQILLVSHMVNRLFFQFHPDPTDSFKLYFDAMFMVVMIIQALDCFVNISCIYLSFAFSETQYKMCKCCHNRVQFCCVNCTKNQTKV
eukprot:314481_1